MRQAYADPHVTGYSDPQNELINDIERLEGEVDEYRRMIRVYNDAVRSGDFSAIPDGEITEYETAGARLQEALALLEDSHRQLNTFMKA